MYFSWLQILMTSSIMGAGSREGGRERQREVGVGKGLRKKGNHRRPLNNLRPHMHAYMLPEGG